MRATSLSPLMRALPSNWILRGAPFQSDGHDGDGEFPAILKHLIAQRGLPAGDELETFLRPRLRDLSDPFEIGEMKEAVDRILLAADRKERVVIYGDYDVDGVSSIAVTRKVLRAYGLEPRAFIPKRSSEGYGLSTAAIARMMSEGEKPDLLISVDCGTISVDEIAALRAGGVDVQHHRSLLQSKTARRLARTGADAHIHRHCRPGGWWC